MSNFAMALYLLDRLNIHHTYEAKDAENKTKTYYNFNAGIVKGNTNVTIDELGDF